MKTLQFLLLVVILCSFGFGFQLMYDRMNEDHVAIPEVAAAVCKCKVDCDLNWFILDAIVDENSELYANQDRLFAALYELHQRLLVVERGY